MEEAGVTADQWWRDETATAWKNEPLRSTTMAFENGRKKMVKGYTHVRSLCIRMELLKSLT
ncbi:hypothetical protein DEO72_LG3g2132 [Vigna unguiculata]|uniref:Uncharacterized protein n=1 Tax=Vigna unguiculata TaxID=3917 RepID=A0A4D6LHF3_VIGUN|nr:hypothetical protein DEO72_LG3g2132 [Vigna unguiculata]